MSVYKRHPKEFLLILALTLLKFTLHLLANSHFGFHRDELLYMALGEHLDWGYKEVPPFIAGISWLSAHLFGDSVFAMRLLSSFCGSLLVYLTGLMVLAMGGKRFAIASACLAVVISPAFLASGYLLQPVVFDQFFWVLSAYYMIRFVQSEQPAYAYALGLSVGLGMLAKYTMAFFMFAMVLGLLLSPRRKVLLNRSWIIACLIALCLFLPNILWQMNNGYPLIRHMRELRETQLNYIKPFDFIIQQILVHGLAVFIWLSGLIYLLISKRHKQFRYLGYAYLITIALLIVLKGKNYYSFGAYPMLFAAGGVVCNKFLGRFNAPLKYGLVFLILAPTLIFLPMVIPVLSFQSTLKFFRFADKRLHLSFPLKWEDQKYHATSQDYADMLGWQEMTAHVQNAYQKIPVHERPHATIIAANYGQAGAIDHFGRTYKLPKTVCLNSSYALWSPENIGTTHLVYVDDEYPDDIAPLYKQVTMIAEVKNTYAREKGTRVFLLSYPVKSLTGLYQSERNKTLQ